MASFSSRLRQILLLIVLISLGLLLVNELYIFLPGFLGAITLYILSRGWYRYLTIRKKWNKSLTATLFLLGFLVLFGLPVYYIINLLSPKITEVFSHSDEVVQGLKSVSAQIKEWTGQELFTDENVVELQKRIANFFPAFLNSTAMILSNLAMMLFVYFFMLTNGKEMEASFDYFLPLHEENIDILASETMSVVRANAIGIPLISLIQGVFALIGYWISGSMNLYCGVLLQVCLHFFRLLAPHSSGHPWLCFFFPVAIPAMESACLFTV